MTQPTFAHRLIRASAGSGKTYHLTSRYLGLLAHGVSPEAILATTFTRKAAGEILDRVLDRLAEAAGDARAALALAAELELKPSAPPDFVAMLRQLLRNLHRVRIGTLDSFYISLAGSFSLELGLPAGWTICEPADDERIRQDALESLLAADDGDVLYRLFQRMTHGQTKRGVHQELSGIVQELYEIQQATDVSVWCKVAAPRSLTPAELEALLSRIEAFDLANDKRMLKARNEDLERARSQNWEGVLSTGIGGKIAAGETTYYSKPIPDEWIETYRTLIRHAASFAMQQLAEQTAATREFLDRYAAALNTHKQSDGGLRFGEVTQALAAALGRQTLQADALAFRLDGSIEHLLLDEFQDTSYPQWQVLRPLAQRLTARRHAARSFFCVGDVKQAIYGWRGGLAEIFDTLKSSLGELQVQELAKSWRSAPPVIDVVNQVFGGLDKCAVDEKKRAGLKSWRRRFEPHATHKTEIPGYVTLETGPAQRPEQSAGDQLREHCAHVAGKIGELHRQAPDCTIGVLCRTNPMVAQMIRSLRDLGVEASEEGGNPLDDSPAVEVLLSLFTLADHPGHSIARFHVRNSPLQERLQPFVHADAIAGHLRSELLAHGYGAVVQRWAECLAPSCNRRDLSRLQQLVEMAYDYQPRSTLRTDDFVSWVRQQKVPDPTGASIRVMTIHGAKGLEFDAVFLPQLDEPLLGQPPAFVTNRDPQTLEVNFVCRYAGEEIQRLLVPEQQRAFDEDRRQRVEESLSVLYVAMTRAIHALHMIIPGKPDRFVSDTWCNLLLTTLTGKAGSAKEYPGECKVLFQHGDEQWQQRFKAAVPSTTVVTPSRPAPITFCKGDVVRRRGLQHVAPSSREGGGTVRLDRMFKPPQGTGTAAGTLYHAWFEAIAWLDDGEPTDAALRAAAHKCLVDLPATAWKESEAQMRRFRQWLQQPELADVLRRAAYADRKHAQFPRRLAPMWSKSLTIVKVERERRFLIPEDDQFSGGSIDRIVWLGDGQKIVAADVIDFKTDALPAGDSAGLNERTEHYRPQLEAYRKAVARLAGLPEDRISARLVFTFAGRVVEV